MLAAWWLLGDRQHERFVTGVTTVKLDARERYHISASLRDRIGVDHFADFETFKDVPVVATLGSIRPASVMVDPRIAGLKARARVGLLTLSFWSVPSPASLPGSPGAGDIAWLVDTDALPAAIPGIDGRHVRVQGAGDLVTAVAGSCAATGTA